MDLQPSLCLRTLKKSATEHGIIFERKMAALVLRRLHRLNCKFFMYKNVALTTPLDDIVILLERESKNYLLLVQLKHGKDSDSSDNIQKFVPKKTENGEMNLRRYFKVYKHFYEIYEGKRTPESDAENYFSKIPIDKVWCIIYTNKVIKGLYSPLSGYDERTGTLRLPYGTSNIQDSSLFELFITSPGGETIQFHDSEHLVWNLMENEPEEKLYQEIFLPRLVIFCGQKHVDLLDEEITKEIRFVYGKNLPPDVERNILLNYHEVVKAWWLESTGEPVSENSLLLEKAVAEELRRRAREAAGNGILHFRDSCCKELSAILGARPPFLRVAVSEMPVGLRAAKLLQVLDTNDGEENRFNWCYVNDRTLEKFPHNELKKICHQCGVIVLDIDNQCNHHFLKDIIENRFERNIIIIFNGSKYDHHILNEAMSFKENWKMEELSEDAQNSFLQRDIQFQGENVVLGELVNTCPDLRSCLQGTELANLASGQKIALGKPLPPPDPICIPRTVQHRTTLKETILDIRSKDNWFVLRGFPEKILSRLRERDSPWHECRPSWATIYDPEDLRKMTFRKLLMIKENICPNVQTKWVNWHPDIEVEYYGQNIHWLTYYQNTILWDKSEGNSDIINDHINKKSYSCKPSPICQHRNENDFINWLDHSIVLPDVTGMGKTTFLKAMARKIKKSYKTSWVIYINVNNVIDLLDEQVEITNAVNVLCREATNNSSGMLSSSTEVDFLKACLCPKSEASGNVAVLVDGIDEVWPEDKNKVFQLLELLQEVLEKGSGRLWVSGRSGLREDLSRRLRCAAPLSLLPFTREDQCNYLLNSWRSELETVEEPDRSRQVNSFVDAVRAATSNPSGTLCDVPLYTKMLSDIYKGDALFLLLRGGIDNIESGINRLYLYKNFVENTLNIRYNKREITKEDKKNLGITDNNYIKYKELAIEKCFSGQENLLRIVRPYFASRNRENDIEINAEDGLVTFDSGVPEFIHFSVVEYLAAQWLFDNIAISSKIRPVIKALYTNQMGESRFFFDALLADESEIHKFALTSHRDHLRRLLNNVNEMCSGGRTSLHLAAIAGNVAIIIDLLAAGANPHIKDNLLNWTPLRYANESIKRCYKNGILETISHMDVIDKLITKGCKSRDIPNFLRDEQLVIYAVEKGYVNIVREVLNKTNTIINLALNNNNVDKYELVYIAAKNERKDILLLLKARGIKVNRIQKGKDLSLHDAAQRGFLEMCSILLQMGADVNETNRNGDTPLHCAARSGNKKICEMFLNHGANLCIRNKNEQTVLFCAVCEAHNNIKPVLTKLMSEEPDPKEVEEEHIQLVKLLIDKGTDVREKCDKQCSALHVASFVGCESLVSFLIDKGLDVNGVDDYASSSLHWAALGGHENVCLRLIKEGADVNHKNSEGYTALHFAAVRDYLNICELLLKLEARICFESKENHTNIGRKMELSERSCSRLPLQNKADPNIQDNNLNIPLHLAALNGSTAACQILIENGANISKKNIKGQQPIHLASSEGHEAICSLILDSGGDIMARVLDGSTALHLAARHGHDNVCRLLIRYGANINAIQYQRNTPLHLAVFAEKMPSTQALLENRANYNIRNKDGYTVFHILAQTGKVGMLQLLVLYVIESNKNPQRTVREIKRECLSLQTTEGSTPLHLASSRGHMDVCKYLIDCGVNINTRDNFNKRALYYAVINGHNLLAQYLVAKGAIEDQV